MAAPSASRCECQPAVKVIQLYDGPETLFYCDPPYVTETRSGKWRERAYVVDMTDDDHRELAEALHQVQGMVLLSGYPSRLYDEFYSDWETRTQMSRLNTIKKGGRSALEVLWLNPQAAQAARQMMLI